MAVSDLWKSRLDQWRFFESWKESQDPARVVPQEQGFTWSQTVRELNAKEPAAAPKVSDYDGLVRLRKAFAALSSKG